MSEADRVADEGDHARAAELAGQAVEIRRRLRGGDDPLTLTAMSDQGRYLNAAGKFDQAELVLQEALAGRRRVLGNDHEKTVGSLVQLASILQELGRYDEAGIKKGTGN